MKKQIVLLLALASFSSASPAVAMRPSFYSRAKQSVMNNKKRIAAAMAILAALGIGGAAAYGGYQGYQGNADSWGARNRYSRWINPYAIGAHIGTRFAPAEDPLSTIGLTDENEVVNPAHEAAYKKQMRALRGRTSGLGVYADGETTTAQMEEEAQAKLDEWNARSAVGRFFRARPKPFDAAKQPQFGKQI